MKAKTALGVPLVGLIVCVGSALLLYRVSAAVAAEEEMTLALTVTCERQPILTCEPLVLEVRISNRGAVPIKIDKSLSLGGPLTLHISGPEGGTRRYKPIRIASRVPTLQTIRPGEAQAYRLVLVYGAMPLPGKGYAACFPFSEPGDYVLAFSYETDTRRLQAEPLKVRVAEVQGRDQEALDLFRGTKQGEFIEDRTKKVVPPELRRLATEYPNTVYGRYARYYLAAMLLEHRFDWSKVRGMLGSELAGLDRGKAELRLVEKVFEKTASEFADLARGEPAFPLADQCLLYQARCYTGSPANRRAEAVAVLEDLVKRFPESPVAVKAKKRLEQFRKQAAKRLEKLGKKAPAPTTRPSSP